MWAGFGVIIVAGMIYGAKKLNDYVVKRSDKAQESNEQPFIPHEDSVDLQKQRIDRLKTEFNCDIKCDETIELKPHYETKYSVNEHNYIGYKSLSHLKCTVKEKPISFNCDRIIEYLDTYDHKVIVLSKDIPCFDSGDREYDSSHRLYFFHDGNDTHALYVGEGYRVASLILYKNIKPQSICLKQLLDRKGFPI